jgi:hypothetical protein
MNRSIPALLLFAALGSLLSAQSPEGSDRHAPTFVERVTLDWDHSGIPATFTLSFQNRNSGVDGDADRLVVSRQGQKPWILLNNDDEWTVVRRRASQSMLRKNLISSKRMLFFRSGTTPEARAYLILLGGGYGCCVGSVTVLTAGQDGMPKVVFHAAEHELQDIQPLPDQDGILLIGQPSDAEAVALRNAESYDPFRIYVIEGDQRARYDLERSKAYTTENYCEWAGSVYNENFVAVNIDSHLYGKGHCKTMTKEQFSAYREKHAAQFP